jgi:two-component system, response regulator YesN
MYSVMIVDDVEIFRRIFKLAHKWTNEFEVVEEAMDGLDALKKLETNPVDIIFIDIKMPRMNGMELLRIIYERKLCPCVVLLSDYTEYSYARQGMIYGAFDYISKSISEMEFNKLLERIVHYLTHRHEEEEKLAELQGIAVNYYFSPIDAKDIARGISQGDTVAAPLIIEMINSIREAYYSDENKGLVVLKNTIDDILNEVMKYYEWLPLYFDMKQFHNFIMICGKDWDKISSFIRELTERLLSIIKRFMPCRDNAVIKKTCEYILTNIHGNLSIRLIAERMYISKSHLSEIFRQRVGVTLLEYITSLKMERAKILLREEEKQNYEIALQLGFQDYEYFNKVFKKYSGKTFSLYRKQQMGEVAL